MRAFLVLLAISVTLCLASCGGRKDAASGQDRVGTGPSLVVQVQQCSRLYTTEFHVRKIVTHDDILRLKGNLLSQKIDVKLPLGERKIAIPMEATLKAYIDFSKFSEDNIERDGERITVVLPDPQVVMTSSKIDQRQIREFVGLTRAHFTDKELTAYEQQGRQAILATVPQLGIVEAAQADAARVLVPMLTEMGYKEENITIAFRKNLDILQLIMSGGQ